MDAWTERATEEARLFNPAFCAMLIGKVCHEYSKKGSGHLAYPLSFLVLPIVLHPRTREALPHSTVTSLLSWTHEHRADLASFGDHARTLTPYTREAIMFGLANGILLLDETGGLRTGSAYQNPTEKKTEDFTSEVKDCLSRAGFVGRWFSGAGTPATIFSALGVTP
jgi:hypothetical protein